MEQVLVTYASKYGATAEIAERIGQVLREAGLPVEVLPAGRVRDLSPYRAVVLGAAVYMFRWRKEAARLLSCWMVCWHEFVCLNLRCIVWFASTLPGRENGPQSWMH